MKYPLVALDDLVNISGGGTPTKSRPEFFTGKIPWVSPKDMKCWEIFDSQDHITQEAIDNRSTKLIGTGAVLVVIRSGVLKHSLPVAINRVPVTLNQDMKALVCTDRTIPEYLARALQAAAPRVLQSVRGTTADNISTDVLRQVEIPLPPLAEQRRIAEVLDRAEALRVKRRAAQLDSLTQSLLLDLFGEKLDAPPIDTRLHRASVPRGCSCELLTDVARLATGRTPDRERDDYWNGEIPSISLTDIRSLDGTVATSTLQNVTPLGIEHSSSVLLPKGTVCFSRTASVGDQPRFHASDDLHARR